MKTHSEIMQMLELADKDFEVAVLTVLSVVK